MRERPRAPTAAAAATSATFCPLPKTEQEESENKEAHPVTRTFHCQSLLRVRVCLPGASRHRSLPDAINWAAMPPYDYTTTPIASIASLQSPRSCAASRGEPPAAARRRPAAAATMPASQFVVHRDIWNDGFGYSALESGCEVRMRVKSGNNLTTEKKEAYPRHKTSANHATCNRRTQRNRPLRWLENTAPVTPRELTASLPYTRHLVIDKAESHDAFAPFWLF